ncbi:MAG: serine/threonine protein kinase [Bacteroidales bacterium]|nr:serine/threonine protein kinase [Bacteroidales bacterium]
MVISSEFENEKIVSPAADEIVLYTSKNTIVKKFRTFGKWQVSKEIAPEFAFDAKHRQSINQEFEIGYQLDHPNIVRYIDKKEYENGVPRLVMEYIDGFTLREVIDGETPVTQRDFDSIFSSILSALAYLHRRQIYHLDIKPENIIVTHKEHIAKLIDFGFAITSSNEKTLGTSKKYVAPEFSERTDDITGKTDIYAFAKTMQEFANAKSLSLSKRQRQIIKCASEENAVQRMTADEALSLLQEPQRKGWIIVILFVVLAIVGFVLVMLRKEEKNEIPQIAHDTVVVEKQQVADSINRNFVPNKTFSNEQITAKSGTKNFPSTIENKSSSESPSGSSVNELKTHYENEDSLVIADASATYKRHQERLNKKYEENMKINQESLDAKQITVETFDSLMEAERQMYMDSLMFYSNQLQLLFQEQIWKSQKKGNAYLNKTSFFEKNTDNFGDNHSIHSFRSFRSFQNVEK